MISIIPLESAAHREWVREMMRREWGSEVMVSRGVLFRPAEHAGFLAVTADDECVGLITYHLQGNICEITLLNSLREGTGIGNALIEAVKQTVKQAGGQRLWLITTNDNLHALRFYQKRGFVLVALYPNALAESRKLKPEIPLIGNDGIPLRDEIELELWL